MAKIAFKKLPVDMRDHLHELSGNELKVWLYFHLRTGADSTSYCLASAGTGESVPPLR